MMRESLMLVIVLTIVCLLSALALALVNNITASRIIEQKRISQLNAVKKALPYNKLLYDNDPGKDMVRIEEWKEKDGKPKDIYVAKKQGEAVGFAFTSSGEGYGGIIIVMVGVSLDEKITGIEIIEHLETPGLGAIIEDPELFKNQFEGKSMNGSQQGELIVVKGKTDKNWEVEAITGATISSRGVVQAVNDGLACFRKYKDQLF